MVLDYFKRLLIVLVIAMFIGMLFVGGTTSLANTKIDDSLINSLIWPTEGIITDTYGTRWGSHFGIDIAAPRGTPIVSVADGEVSRSYYSPSYGNVIFIEHENGLETVYAHLHERFLTEGNRVSQGQQIGTVGNTGRSSGDHLHFEVHIGNWNVEKSNSIDPFLVLKEEQHFVLQDAKVEEEEEGITDELFQAVLSMRYSVEDSDKLEIDEKGQDLQVEKRTSTEIVVQRGDTLWGLAQTYGVSVNDIVMWNNLSSDVLTINQTLTVYEYDESVHFVQPGDSLIQIANQYDISVEEIKELNELSTELIYPGDVLLVDNN